MDLQKHEICISITRQRRGNNQKTENRHCDIGPIVGLLIPHNLFGHIPFHNNYPFSFPDRNFNRWQNQNFSLSERLIVRHPKFYTDG